MNPKENANVVTLRRGKQYDPPSPPMPSKLSSKPQVDCSLDEDVPPKPTNPTQPTPKLTFVTPPHFPSRLKKTKKEEVDKEILDTFCKVEVNIPLLDAIKQMSRYAKFLKELCTNKRKLRGNEKVSVGENVSAVLQKKLPPKCKDPNTFTIPCTIGNKRIECCMLDLGASINVMPFSIYASLNLGPLEETWVIIDRSNAYPRGVIEDVLVQVNELVFPAYFYVLDMEDESISCSTPILLGRPFMKTARIKIDVHDSTLTMEFDGETIRFNIFEAMRYPSDVHVVYSLDVLDIFSQRVLDLHNEVCLEVALREHLVLTNEDFSYEIMDVITALNSGLDKNFKKVAFMDLPISNEKFQPSIVQAPTLELKSIGWSIADIKGINPSMWMHQILLEEWSKPTREAQRRLNPPMMEVVKKEILKLHSVGIIYPISDSQWIVIAPEDQEKTTFTCPFGTFAFRLKGIEVDKEKIDLIRSLPPPTSVKEVRSFLGHVEFYRRFIKDFSKISTPLCNLLQKDVKFEFNEKCLVAFNLLKESLTTSPIIQPPNWELPFELMCDASDYVVGVVLGQRVDKLPHVICYASRTLNDAQLNYSTTKKELLVEIKDKKGSENLVADHLSRLIWDEDNFPMDEKFPDEQLLTMQEVIPWYAGIVNYLASKELPSDLTQAQ
ncbi:uncharacterized protein LOC133791574 [Humulus lupulus]|uniref:uncharacterized protein LOC133791574 n=1 Tax=Humulus lupulus TaxID=3486 RepID=UPI002B410BFA|nr:uncharacterized protein LOC133791574 [Humulus lupulus]